MKIYTIIDNRDNSFWKHKAKQSWISKGAAKNALIRCFRLESYRRVFSDIEVSSWLNKKPHRWDNMTFKDQNRFKCLEFDLAKLEGIEV
jgi:hypothetical protein